LQSISHIQNESKCNQQSKVIQAVYWKTSNSRTEHDISELDKQPQHCSADITTLVKDGLYLGIAQSATHFKKQDGHGYYEYVLRMLLKQKKINI